jgi:trans-2,3-dihydro-3-hydroxyanthranilate isomerase
MFGPLGNNREYPATGSASAALGACLVSLQLEEDMTARIDIEQGGEMGRPSAIAVTAHKAGGQVVSMAIEGSCVEVIRGTITV